MTGLWSCWRSEELRRDFLNAKRIVRLFNGTTEEELEGRKKILSELFEKAGENIYIEPPFHCDYGCNIFLL